jgi:hypothetical protein
LFTSLYAWVKIPYGFLAIGNVHPDPDLEKKYSASHYRCVIDSKSLGSFFITVKTFLARNNIFRLDNLSVLANPNVPLRLADEKSRIY